MKNVEIRNAHIHNLKNIDIDIPKDKFVVIGGVSGSGKSSLIFDILYEEGKTKYFQTIGFSSRVIRDPQFDLIRGLAPTVAIGQKTVRMSNPRSTVGTKTELYNLLRMLFSLDGIIKCPICKTPVNKELICENCGMQAERLPIKYFSFNEASGMCLHCKGRGFVYEFSLKKLIPDENLDLYQICETGIGVFSYMRVFVPAICRKFGFDAKTPFKDIPTKARDLFLYGSEEVFEITEIMPKRTVTYNTKIQGLINELKTAVTANIGKSKRQKIEANYVTKIFCPQCKGYRLNAENLEIKINNKHIGELGSSTINDLGKFLLDNRNQNIFSKPGKAIVKVLLEEIKHLADVGLSHLTLFREIPSLSGGELQRLSFANTISSGLNSLIYIFDEPTVGLHETEKEKLIEKLLFLKSQDNSVMVIEHDKMVLTKAEHIIEIGPGAGKEGGDVIYEGEYSGLLESDKSVIAPYLSGKNGLPLRKKTIRSVSDDMHKLRLENINTNNLKNISIDIPLGIIVGIAGVSGSGKSSLIENSLVPLLQNHFDPIESKNNDEDEEYEYETIGNGLESASLLGCQNIDNYVVVSQAPIGRSRKSIPASYVKIWDKIRKIYSSRPSAKEAGLTSSHFTFNSEKGQCPVCKGDGVEKFEVSFLDDINLLCQECNGNRYNEKVLNIRYKDKNIVDILNMSVSEARDFFLEHKAIHSVIKILDEVGMGYLTLGQPVTTLSGGEAQRVKLAKELGRTNRKNTLYIFDEPTIGLGFPDIDRLILLLEQLVESGNSVLMIEHEPQMLSYCDWLIELGPGGGPDGGEIIGQGVPADLKADNHSIIGRYLDID